MDLSITFMLFGLPMGLSVIGAGVVGLCIATELTSRGAEIELVDHAHPPGPHACSWWAGGMLAPWCECESADEPVLRLGRESFAWWQQHIPVTRAGTLVVALGRDKGELDRFARRTSEYEMQGAAEIGVLEPDLAGRFDRALYYPHEAHLSPRDALTSLTDRLAADGVVIREAAHSGATTIDCRGLSARDALSDLRGVKGEMLIIRCPDVTLTRPVRLLHPRIPLYIVPRGDSVYMLGATMIESNDRGRITARSLLEMLSAAYALHPAFAEAEVIEIGVDARPAFPDNLPRIRRKGKMLWVNGLYRHGFLLSPALARMTADLVLDGKIPEVMDEGRS